MRPLATQILPPSAVSLQKTNSCTTTCGPVRLNFQKHTANMDRESRNRLTGTVPSGARGWLIVSRDLYAIELTDRFGIERSRPFLSNSNRVSAPSRRQVSGASRRAGRCRMGL